MKATIETIFVGNSLRNFTYLISAGDNQYYCVDPFDAKGIEERLTQLGGELKGIINTHQHHDHICGNSDLIEKHQAPLYAHHKASYDREFHGVKGGDYLDLDADNRLLFLDTPGHTMTHISLVMEFQKTPWAILSGDTMFNAGVGHCKLGGHPEVLYKTMSDIYGDLSDELELYPGHEYFENNLKFSLHCEPENAETTALLDKVGKINWYQEEFRTTMEQERKVNPFLRLHSVNLRKNLDMVNSTDKELFLKLRTMRNSW